MCPKVSKIRAKWRFAKSNPIVAGKALGFKIAKTVWHILTHGSDYDGERLFGPARSSNTAAA